MSSGFISRFAPSPTGYLHLGNMYSALFSFEKAQQQGGTCLLRIEDIDQQRCKREYEDSFYEDLRWMGLQWPEAVKRQSDHIADYVSYTDQLKARGLLYPCFCSRKEMREDFDKNGGKIGPDGPVYSGRCKALSEAQRAERLARGDAYALRLDVAASLKQVGKDDIRWHDDEKGWQDWMPSIAGDIILVRKDCPTTYHAAVVIDDHLQNVTCVTRGQDLFEASHIHVLLQALWGVSHPNYHHHALLHDGDGNILSKRYKSLAVRDLRDKQQKSPEDIRALIDRFKL